MSAWCRHGLHLSALARLSGLHYPSRAAQLYHAAVLGQYSCAALYHAAFLGDTQKVVALLPMACTSTLSVQSTLSVLLSIVIQRCIETSTGCHPLHGLPAGDWPGDLRRLLLDSGTDLDTAAVIELGRGLPAGNWCEDWRRRLLLDSGTDLDIVDKLLRELQKQERQNETGHIQIVQVLLDAGVSRDTVDAEGCSMLVRATEMGHVRMVQLLLDAGASPNNESQMPRLRYFLEQAIGQERASQLHKPHSPLFAAVWSGHTVATRNSLVCMLIKAGSDPTAVLFSVAERGNVSALRFEPECFHTPPPKTNYHAPIFFAIITRVVTMKIRLTVRMTVVKLLFSGTHDHPTVTTRTEVQIVRGANLGCCWRTAATPTPSRTSLCRRADG